METYLTNIKRLSYAISMGEGAPLGDQVVAATIINGLPKSFDSWVIGKSGHNKLDPDQLCNELRIIAQRIEQRNKNNEEESEQGFNTKNSRGYSSQNQPSKKPFNNSGKNEKVTNNQRAYNPRKETRECYFCHKVGHLARNCRKKNESQRANSTKEEDFTFAMGEDTESSEDFTLTLDNDNKSYHESWIMDSGASSHMSNSEKWFSEIAKLEKPTMVTTANGQEVRAEGKGIVVLVVTDNNNKEFRMKLENVLYIPGLETNLVSVKSITTHGHKVQFDEHGGSVDILGKGEKSLPFKLKSKLYHLEVGQKNDGETTNVVTVGQNIQTWHERLGHAAKQMLPKLKHAVDGLDLTTIKSDTCEVCVRSNLTKKPSNSVREELQNHLNLYIQMCGDQLEHPVRLMVIDTQLTSLMIIQDTSRSIHENQG